MTDVVGLHGSTHLPNGVDPLPISGSSIGGLCPKTPNDSTKVLLGGATASFGPVPLHGPTHISTGRDPIPVATTAATGLLPALSGKVTDVLLGTGTWGAGFFPGFIADYAGYAVPAGWLLCDGQAYSRTTYAGLYAALGGSGSPWGQGNGSSTFNVPDLRGRVSVGAGQGANLAYRSVGSYGGEETHTLSVYEMPVHNHLFTDPGHAHSVYDPGHTHSIYDPTHQHQQQYYQMQDPNRTTLNYYGYAQAAAWNGSNGPFALAMIQTGPTTNNPNAVEYTALAGTGISIYTSAARVSIYASDTGLSIQNAGSGGAHNNMQPFAVLNKIIHI
jgi:microcystin-dependent protein